MESGRWRAPAAHGPVRATLRLPGSKSISNRALMLAAVSDSPSTLRGLLKARDTSLALAALQVLGCAVDETGSALSRRYASGMVALRPDQDGRITGCTGAEEMNEQYGEWIIDAHLPSPGTATQPVEAGYMANAYVRMRHPDYDALRGMLDAVGQMLHVYAS